MGNRTGVDVEIPNLVFCWQCQHFEKRYSDVCLHPSNKYSDPLVKNYKTNYITWHFKSYPPQLNKDNNCSNFEPLTFLRKIAVRLFDLHA